jgi:hypothetical protein
MAGSMWKTGEKVKIGYIHVIALKAGLNLPPRVIRSIYHR